MHMHGLADWVIRIAKLHYCIKIDICIIICSIVDQADCNIIVDLIIFVHSSGPSTYLLVDLSLSWGGGSSEPRDPPPPPPPAMALP